MKRVAVQLEPRRRSLTVDGRSTVLQEKTWQVLSMLIAQAPAVVSRADIIDSVWGGSFLTGDKGLNQAIWAIRSALADDPKDPGFIRTVPRVGYQWIHDDLSSRDANAGNQPRRAVSLAAGVAALLLVPAATMLTSMGSPESQGDRVATNAYRVGRDIHVEFTGGCLGILKNESHADLGAPVLSADGAHVAVTIQRGAGCRLMTIDVSTGEKQEFGHCPSDVT